MKKIFKLLFIALTFKATSMTAQTITTNHIKTNGYDFTYLEAGTGQMIMFLHGFPDNPYSFKAQMTALAKAGYHCVAPYKRALRQMTKW